MFCFQCQETAGNTGCKVKGVCGKNDELANLQDLLIFAVKGIAVVADKAREKGIALDNKTGKFMTRAIFATITNANFDEKAIIALIKEALKVRDALKCQVKSASEGCGCQGEKLECATWTAETDEEIRAKASTVGVLTTGNEDIRSLRELIMYGLKGVAAYANHAADLDHEDPAIYSQIVDALVTTVNDVSVDDLVAMVMKTGGNAVTTLALLDKANTARFGHPEITKVNLGVRKNPGILISGHELRDLEDLLEQTKGTGVDVYTHSEMLPAHYYPKFKKYDNLVGNYGSSWWHQNEDFESFQGAILFTTNCIIPIKGTYQSRMFTTGAAGYPGCQHIAERTSGGRKDFSEVIKAAKACPPPKEIERGEIVGGFAHNQVLALADKVVAAVKSGAIKRFVVIAGCDGRQKDREYFTDVAKGLPQDAVILTAGCAKYRYNKLSLGDIGGIPRVLDAGQCNDSYSLAVIALKLKEVFGLDDINKLPISYDIAWYEQKAVAVLLALLFLGVKHIRLGPTIPAFLSPNVVKVLVEKFDIKPTTTAEVDIPAIMAGEPDPKGVMAGV
ncbi:MAG: hydroxylamine reductase [Candidatus Omnitrophica bacterium]|nr:hydroxylamine reductase [Candidatus Omnitrophota bacterium]